MVFRSIAPQLASLAAGTALALSGCGYGKPTVPPTDGGIADSAASAAATMRPAKASNAPSAP